MTSDDRVTRRRYLAGAAGLAAASALSGCLGGGDAPLDPKVPEEKLAEAGWELTGDPREEVQQTVEFAGVSQDVTARVDAEIYENVDLRAKIESTADDVAGEDLVDRAPSAVFYAAKAETDPPVTRLLSLSDTAVDELMNRAEAELKRQLREQGFENVERVEEDTIDVAAAGTAEHRRYRAERPYQSQTFTRNGVTVEVESGEFTVEAQLAVWPYEGLLASAGGAYPGEDETLTLRAAGRTRDLSLDLRPETYREEVRQFSTQVA